MAVTPDTLRARFPEVACESDYSDAQLQLAIDDARLIVSAEWEKFEDVGASYLAMHNLWLSDRTAEDLRGAGAAVGPMASKTVGQVSASYAVSGLDANDPDYLYSSTVYGRKFIEYRRLAFPVSFMVV